MIQMDNFEGVVSVGVVEIFLFFQSIEVYWDGEERFFEVVVSEVNIYRLRRFRVGLSYLYREKDGSGCSVLGFKGIFRKGVVFSQVGFKRRGQGIFKFSEDSFGCMEYFSQSFNFTRGGGFGNNQ